MLYAAIAGAAKFARQDSVFGRVARGYVADLLVLDADPTVTVRNARLTRHVIRAGRVLDGRNTR